MNSSTSSAQIFFVFNHLDDWQTLANAAPEGSEVVVLDGGTDGLAQIAAHLAGRQGALDAIHILSHGQPGQLQLGSLVLDQAALEEREAVLAQIGRALGDNGDILLYGCDVAAGPQGQAFVDALARLTGADVAASDNLTGSAAAGGDWVLEAQAGIVEANTEWAKYSLFSTVLANQTINLTGAVSSGSLTSGTFSLGGINFAVTSESGFTITQVDGGILFEETAAGGDFSLTITDPGVNNQFSAKSIYIDNTSTGGDPGYGAYLSIQQTTYSLSFSETRFTGNPNLYLSQNMQSGGNYDIGSTFVLTDIEQGGYSIKTKFFIKDFVIDLAATNDFTAPRVSSITRHTPATEGTNADSLAYRVTFNEAVINVDASDFTVSGTTATVTNVVSAGANRYDITVSGGDLAAYNGIATLSFAPGQNITDGAENALTNTTPTGVNNNSYTLDNTAPAVASVNSTTADGIYKAGDVIAIQVVFSESVTVTGTPQLTLETGITDRVINYAGGSGSSTLTFNYTVQAGDSSADLDYLSTTALALNGGTVHDAVTNNAVLTLPSPGGANSLGINKAIVIDAIPPTTTISSASFSNDSATPGDFITNSAAQIISGSLSANLLAGETVQVSLNNGATWATAQAGDSTWSLAGGTLTASGTLLVKVSDAAGNDGAVLSRSYVYDISAPDTTFSDLAFSADSGAPGDFKTHTAAQTISATLSGALSGGDILYASLDNGSSWSNITSKVSGTALSWDGVTLAGSNTLQLKVADAAGNEGDVRTQAYVLDTSTPDKPGTPVLSSVSDTGVSNSDKLTSDTTPTLSGTAESGSTVTLHDDGILLGSVTAVGGEWTYTTSTLGQGVHTITAIATDIAGNVSPTSEQLMFTVDAAAPFVTSVGVPDHATYYVGQTLGFTVNFDSDVIVDTGGGTPRIALVVGATTSYANYVSGSGTKALVFEYNVLSGDMDANGITLGALSANGGVLQDAAGNNALTTLNSVGSTAAVNVDGTSPSVTGVSASTADGAYGSGATITIVVDFSTAVVVDTSGGTPALALDNGGSAIYIGGSGSNTLTFSYTVAAGQNSADLDYGSSGALALNAATIRDAGGSHQAAALTLPTPGTAGSLGANKNIVIDTAAPTNTVATAAFSADTGTSGSDFVTKKAAQTISGTLASNLAAGEHVHVSLDNGASWTLATASTGASSWSLAGQTLAGSGTLKVRVSDNAGNHGTAYEQAYTLDTTAPAITFSGLALSADTGTSSTDLITNTSAQTISAALSSAPAGGDIVYGSLDNGATWSDITSMVSGTTLSWTGVTLAASNTLQLKVTDAAGNDGGVTSKAYVLDTAAPATSVATVAFSADTGASTTDFITRTEAQTISGTLSANLAADERVLVSLDNGASWAEASATVGNDSWTLAGQTLTHSDTLQVKVSDQAGNDGAVLSQAYVYDTAASAATVSPLSTMSLLPVLSGSAALEAGETMTVSVGGASYDVTPVAGSWSLDLATAVPTSGTLTLAMNQRYNVVATVVDLAGNSSNDASNGELTIGVIAPTEPSTPPTPVPVPVDGVPVVTTPGDGGTTIISIPVVTPSRPDTPGTTSPLADIPLVKGSDGHPILQVSVPVGVALQAQGLAKPVTGAAALAELGLRIERSAGGDAELTHNGQVFLATLDPTVPLTIQTITATPGAGFNPDIPLVISGSAIASDGMQAVILDARALPAGTTIQVDNVDFIAVVGAVRIIGGAGQNMASGDGAAQYIVLGEDDDVLHGGGGNDTVGSQGGDDKIHGDAGNDIVFGGAGNDLLSGGSGSDRLNGGTGFDVAVQEGKRSDYTLVLDGAGIKLTHVASGVSDWLVDVEQVRFATGPSLTVAHSAAEEAAAHLFQQWMGRDLTQSEGAAIQTLEGLSALQVADLFAQVFPQQAGGRSAQQLLEGMSGAGAIRVDAARATTFTGDAGDNSFTPAPGLAWSVDGGAGTDTVVFPASFAQLHIEASDAGFTLQRMTDGAMLELSKVERLTLQDTQVALDLDGHAGTAAKLIGAVAGAAFLDNKPLVGEVIRALDAGMSAQSLAQLGLQLLGAQTPGQVTQLLWTNVVGSAATPAQLQPFVAMLAQGVTGGELAVLASDLELNAVRIDLVGLAAMGIEFA